MPKFINYITSNIRTIIVLCFLLFLAIYSTYKYNQTYEIQYSYEGIKYQANNLNSGTPVSIEIDGVYKKGYFGNADTFTGNILIDGALCYSQYRHKSHEYAFNNYNMGLIEAEGFKGDLFIGDMFNEITIELHEIDTKGLESFSYMNGWLISALSSNREQATQISNRLIQRLHKDIIIE